MLTKMHSGVHIVNILLVSVIVLADSLTIPGGYEAGGNGYDNYGLSASASASAGAPAQRRRAHKEQQQDLSKVPGVPGVDYPLYHSVPQTSFSCEHVPALPRIYANVETGCQAYHVCHDGREGKQGSSFLCTNGTIFNQAEFTCDWWYNVNCHDAPAHYNLNLDPRKNPYIPKPKPEETQAAPVYAHY